jgi:hypothetical protein
MNRFLLIAAACLLAFAPATAGTGQSNAQATAIQRKMRQLELIDQILPVLLTKEQINKLLPTIQTARQEERNLQYEEAQALAGLEAKVDTALDNAVNKKQVVPVELAREIRALYAQALVKRSALVSKHSKAIGLKVVEVLDEGQRAAAANALDPRIFDASLDPATMSQADKLGYWATGVLLDPDSYDMLVKLSI